LSIYLLSDAFHEGVVNLPQIKITFRDIELDLTPYDALIFSSKNGVKAIDSINKNWKKIPSYAIGGPTANTIINLTLFILAFGLAVALFQGLYFSASLITIFAVVIDKYVKDNDFRDFLNYFF